MWPYASGRPGEQFSLLSLRDRLRELDDDLVVRLWDDGMLRLAHPAMPEIIVATIDLTCGYGPMLQQRARFPRLIKEAVTAAWDEFEHVVGPEVGRKPPGVQKGPVLLTSIDAAVGLYCDRPPWEEGASATRILSPEDVNGGGWFVEFLDAVFSPTRRVRIRGRHRPWPSAGVGR